MKLNHDCIRDVMIFIEENLTYGQFINFSTIEILNYSREELIYTADKLIEAEYLVGSVHTYAGHPIPDIHITAMTWAGHQFIDTVRDDGVWANTKRLLSKFSSVSLGIASTVSSNIITSIVQEQLNQHLPTL